MTAQPGIFGLGTPEHCFLELDLAPGRTGEDLVRALTAMSVPLSSGGGVNVVLGFRPELWATLGEGPLDAASFSEPLVGPDGFTMPATQHDAWAWVAGVDRTAVFDNTRELLTSVDGVASLAGETTGWHYSKDRDLTGFIDGTENPSLLAAPQVALVPVGEPGAGCSVLLYQVWVHATSEWEALPQHGQELAMGRTKPDSVELTEDVMPQSSHVSRTKVYRHGEEQDIFRRNVSYGGITDHGTVFVGFGADRWRLHEMLRQMTGVVDGVRCELTRYVTPLTGAYYTVPPVEALAAFAPVEVD